MSDTTITPEERARLRSVLSEHGNPQVEDRIILRLLNTIEQAEARVKSRNNHIHRLLGEALESERNLDGMKSRLQEAEARAERAEANVARLTKMVDFMAQQMADVYSTDEDGRYVLTCPVRTLRAADHDCDKISCPQCWKEAARRAVAAGEE